MFNKNTRGGLLMKKVFFALMVFTYFPIFPSNVFSIETSTTAKVPLATFSLENIEVPQNPSKQWEFTSQKDMVSLNHSVAMQFIVPKELSVVEVELRSMGFFKNISLTLCEDVNDSPGAIVSKLGTAGFMEAEGGNAIKVLSDLSGPIPVSGGKKFWLVAMSSGSGQADDFWAWNKREASTPFPLRADSFDQGKTWKVEKGSFAARIGFIGSNTK
jgi:hypothetical protein